MSDGVLGDLNELFHVKARLGIMTLLISQGESDFSTLKAHLGLTDGNLGAHIRVLEEAGYVGVEKGFVGRRPRTTCRVTEAGRKAFAAYLHQLEALIRMVDPDKL
ncbi:MAG: transcriptional regulator [Symbiobacteriaceae bacterium]|jgi:DNA-binding MarR family transcriptional regulator|nr:transcriptional regulator [Symbiobacteriaceae bacterium]